MYPTAILETWQFLKKLNIYLHSDSDSEVAQSCPTLCDPMAVAHQAPPSMGFSRQEYWSGLPFPSPGDLPDPGIEPRSPTLQADALTSAPPGKHGVTQLNASVSVCLRSPFRTPASQGAQDSVLCFL